MWGSCLRSRRTRRRFLPRLRRISIPSMPGCSAPCARPPRVVDIQAAQATKGQAARRLAQLLGKKILAVAGDSQNDLSMLDAADLAFVPADASIDKTPYCEVAPCSNGQRGERYRHAGDAFIKEKHRSLRRFHAGSCGILLPFPISLRSSSSAYRKRIFVWVDRLTGPRFKLTELVFLLLCQMASAFRRRR